MYISKLTLSNYKNFGIESKEITFKRGKNIIIGKNNSGKSNLLTALDILLGSRNPRYIRTDESDYYDPKKPLKIIVELLAESENEIYETKVKKNSKGAFYSKFKEDPNSAKVKLKFEDSIDEGFQPKDGKFSLKVSGISHYQNIDDIRNSLLQTTKVPALRSVKDELKGTHYTTYGNLMKDIVEGSERYQELVQKLREINELFEEVLEIEKKKILQKAQLVTYINDLKFQLTKDDEPSELTRNLEVLVKDLDKFVHISETGTGTQNAVILSLLELALINKAQKSKAFFVEEPEAFIHPQGIKYLASLFDDILDDDISQLIATTHSIPLLSQFLPSEIIRLEKRDGETIIHQFKKNFVDENKRILRSLLSNNSEMYFADKVVLVEGETEKILLPELSKQVDLSSGETANFLRHNITTVDCGGRDQITNFIKVLDQFNIEWVALVDNDFLSKKQFYSTPCKYLNIDKGLASEEMRKAFKKVGFAIIKEGEIESLVPTDHLVEMTDKSKEEINQAKQKDAGKVSKAFEKVIFNKSKAEYAFDLVEYYIQKSNSPFDTTIKWLVEK